MMELDFSEEEIQGQLAALGYKNIPDHKLRKFKQDLDDLVRREEWKSLTSCAQTGSSPPAFTKEKVRPCDLVASGQGFFLHGKVDQDRQALAACQNREPERRQRHLDSYARHSVAVNVRLPPGAPSRLQVEPDPDDSLHPPLSDASVSSVDAHRARLVKRKVLRKYKMSSAQDDGDSLYSSFWSDGDRQEDEEDKVEFKGAIKPAGDAEESDQEEEEESDCDEEGFSQEEEEVVKGERKTKCVESMDSDQEEEEEEEESNPLSEGGDSLQEEEEEDIETLSDEGDEEEEEETCREVSSPDGDEENSSQNKPELNDQVRGESVEGGDDGDDEDEDEDEDGCSSTSDSPAQSLMTSGYGTYRPEQEGGDYRDDHTLTEFDQDSRTDLSETRDEEEEEEERSLCGLAAFGDETTRRLSVEPEDEERWCSDEGRKGAEQVESEDSDKFPRNERVKFIDLSHMTLYEMCEWEGNLRLKQDAAISLEDRLADLHLSSSPRRHFETENEDVDATSSESDVTSVGPFEAYMRGMTGAQRDLRPKPKSFIRPVTSRRTNKTDPVAKYFQYKQLWAAMTLPGESDRRAIRSEIKERLAYQPPPPKPRRLYVPNTYVVPTEKKRSALRWEIRNDLANGVLPYKFTYRF